jgi:hypothetical protein
VTYILPVTGETVARESGRPDDHSAFFEKRRPAFTGT